MKTYVVAFDSHLVGKTYTKCRELHEFESLKDAREYARMFLNGHIYSVAWTDGNGMQYIKELKVM